MADDITEDQIAPEPGPEEDPWTQKFYARGTSGFERAVFFSDAIYAISLTLVAVQLVLPALDGLSKTGDVGAVISSGFSNLIAYAFTFLWVAFYWKANHRFTLTLRRINDRYIWALLVYLAFIALLPFPAAILGEAWDPRALAFFFVYLACVSALEVLLILIALRDDLLIRQLNRPERRQWVISSLSPVIAALIAAPTCFIPTYGNWLAVGVMVLVSTSISFTAARRYRAWL
ncbi:MAG: TMEM175 family protein [Candidatus Nanopelagicales bacterium]|jgi:uncharacterized membrane protein